MNIPSACPLIVLGSFGYTEDEARFLYLVATHSGYFTCQQFCSIHPRQNLESAASHFVLKAGRKKGHASALVPAFGNGKCLPSFRPGIFTKPSAKIMFDSVANTRPNTSAPGSSRLISF